MSTESTGTGWSASILPDEGVDLAPLLAIDAALAAVQAAVRGQPAQPQLEAVTAAAPPDERAPEPPAHEPSAGAPPTGAPPARTTAVERAVGRVGGWSLAVQDRVDRRIARVKAGEGAQATRWIVWGLVVVGAVVLLAVLALPFVRSAADMPSPAPTSEPAPVEVAAVTGAAGAALVRGPSTSPSSATRRPTSLSTASSPSTGTSNSRSSRAVASSTGPPAPTSTTTS